MVVLHKLEVLYHGHFPLGGWGMGGADTDLDERAGRLWNIAN